MIICPFCQRTLFLITDPETMPEYFCQSKDHEFWYSSKYLTLPEDWYLYHKSSGLFINKYKLNQNNDHTILIISEEITYIQAYDILQKALKLKAFL